MADFLSSVTTYYGHMEMFLIDANGPFFRDHPGKRINWSKIPFAFLDESPERWQRIHEDMRKFSHEVATMGYNTVSLDDVAHLYHHPMHSAEVTARIAFLREQFRSIMEIIRSYQLDIFLTIDAVPMTEALAEHFCDDHDAMKRYFREMIKSVLDDFPEVSGVILRIGESDGKDVKDPIRSHLLIRNAAQANALLLDLLPEFAARNRTLIFRTWTVGAYGIGDLIWHRDTMNRTLRGVGGPHFIVSMKHGESDFFRYLPLNKAFFHLPQRKLLEMQCRREYEGAGEYPSFILKDALAFRDALDGVENMAGISVWCQTGGWHRFRRLALLEDDGSDVWIRANVLAAIRVFRYGDNREDFLTNWQPAHASAAGDFIDACDDLIERGLYIRGFAQEKRFFRRLRLPPLLHAYWDSVYVHPFLRSLKNALIAGKDDALSDAVDVMKHFPQLRETAIACGWSEDDIDHMEDLWNILRLVRAYYFSDDTSASLDAVIAAKRMYKIRWPAPQRMRYRIKTNFPQSKQPPWLVKSLARLLLRGKRGYRLFDHVVIIHGLSYMFQTYTAQNPKALPKAMRKLAMGVDTIFR